MKNYKVIALRNFNDALEKKPRTKGKEFECTKERYIYLKSKGAVELVEIIEEKKDLVATEKPTIEEIPNATGEIEMVLLNEVKTKAKKTTKKTSKK